MLELEKILSANDDNEASIEMEVKMDVEYKDDIPKDEKSEETEAEATAVAPCQIRDEPGINAAVLEEYLMKESDGNEGTITKEKVEMMLGIKPTTDQPTAQNISEMSYHSLTSKNSMVVKMRKVEVKNSISSTNDSRERKEAATALDTASSAMKGTKAKKART